MNTAIQIKMKLSNFSNCIGSLNRKYPNKNCNVGVIQKIIPAGPNPDSLTPFTYRNKGITVMGPANIKIIIKVGFETSKSLKLFFVII